MSYRSKSIMLFLRPTEYLQRYEIRNVAKWLLTKFKFRDFNHAVDYLIYMQQYYPYKFKAIVSRYFEETEYLSDYKRTEYPNGYDINSYQTSNIKLYGEPHMYY
jgi:hypothetical protein